MIFDRIELKHKDYFVRNFEPKTVLYRVFGADTETKAGKPISLQIFGRGKKYFKLCDESNILDHFFAAFEDVKSKNVAVYFHNLQFDIVEIFYKYKRKLADSEAEFEHNGWSIQAVYANTCFAICRKEKQTIYILDSFAFFKASLKKLAKLFCPNLPKLTKPEDLGKKYFNPEDKEFKAYAMRDAEIAYHIGLYIKSLSTKYQIGICFSAPHMAAKIFRTHYMQQDMPLISQDKIESALKSYHGGKNGVYVETPQILYNVHSYDIVSAYSDAMLHMPSFYEENLYKKYMWNSKKDEPINEVPPYGVYCVSGKTKKCKYPILFHEDFTPINGEEFTDWVTGFEINEALRKKELDINWLIGYYYEYNKDTNKSPFVEYVKYFFDKKKHAEKDSPDYIFFKLMQNSLYGKFIQKEEVRYFYGYNEETNTIDGEIVIQPGGLFHPFIASLITGFVRAKIHDIEHKYKSIHTSTDGILSQVEPTEKEKNGSNIGDLGYEYTGNMVLLRNKLYLIYNDEGDLIKADLHAFHGSSETLENMIVSRETSYKYTKVVKLKESYIQDLLVNEFLEVEGHIKDIDFSKINIKEFNKIRSKENG